VPRFGKRPYSTRLARRLRSSLTEPEVRLWSVLRYDFPQKFRRQEPLGPYIADFVCYSHRLVVEVDGGQHAESEADARRDRYLTALGFRVLRVWNADVMLHLEDTARAVEAALMEQGDRLGVPWPED